MSLSGFPRGKVHGGAVDRSWCPGVLVTVAIAISYPKADIEVATSSSGTFLYGEPVPKDGYSELDENIPMLRLTVKEESLTRFTVIA